MKEKADLNLVEINVARRIASLRKDNELTLKELGAAAGLSEAYLSRVENLKTAINIANLSRLAEALGVSVSVFFEDSGDDRPVVVCRAGKGKKMRFRGRKGLRVSLLADGKKDKLMEPILVDVDSANPDGPMKSHSGHEFIYVVEGSLLLSIGKEEIEMGVGDSAYFDARLEHRVRPANGGKTRALSIVTSKDYHFHGDISRIIDVASKA